MLSYSLPVCVTLVLIYVVFKYLLHPGLLSPLRKVPAAHVLAPWSSLWILRKRIKGGENQTLLQAHRRLGEVIRVGPSEVCVNSLEGLKAIYLGNFDKHPWFAHVSNVEGVSNAFSSLDAKSHAESRRLFSNAYSKSFIQTSSEVHQMFEDLVWNSLMPPLQKAAENSRSIAIPDFSCAIGYDFTSRFMLGSEAGTQILQDTDRYQDLLREHDQIRAWFGVVGEFLPSIEWLDSFGIKAIPSAVFESFAGRIKHVSNMCKTAKANPGSNAFVYDKASYAFDKTQLSCPKDPRLLSELFDQLLAGLETLTPAVIYTIYELSQKTDIQDKLRVELATLEMNGRIPDARALDSLPLLDAVIQETLRRYPPVPIPLPRMVPKGGIELGGYVIPEGTKISCNAFSLHHTEKVFPNSETWNPDRWLKSDPEQIKEMKRWFWAFGSGARMCLGLHFALQELKYVIAAMYMNFRTSIGEAGDMTQMDGFVGRPVGGKLDVKFERLTSVA